MAGIDEEGFLSPELDYFQTLIHEKYAPYFELVRRINAFCHKVKKGLTVDRTDSQKLTAIALLIKVLNDAQAVVLLIERGLQPQARTILRSGFEGLFLLANTCQREEFYKAYLHDGEKRRLTQMQAIAHNDSEALDEIRARITDDRLNKLAGELKGIDLKIETIDKLASLAGLSATYDTAYRLLCHDAHSSAYALDIYIETDSSGRLSGFVWGAITDNLHPELASAAILMLAAIQGICELFKFDLREDLKRLNKEVDALKPPSRA